MQDYCPRTLPGSLCHESLVMEAGHSISKQLWKFLMERSMIDSGTSAILYEYELLRPPIILRVIFQQLLPLWLQRTGR